MKEIIKRFFFFVILAICLIFNACNKNPVQLTNKQALELAQSFFNEIYGKNISLEKLEYKQVGQNKYLNLIIVSDREEEYELILDENNKPLTDNFLSLKLINVSSKMAFRCANLCILFHSMLLSVQQFVRSPSVARLPGLHKRHTEPFFRTHVN